VVEGSVVQWFSGSEDKRVRGLQIHRMSG
jgi:hypothetical protein